MLLLVHSGVVASNPTSAGAGRQRLASPTYRRINAQYIFNGQYTLMMRDWTGPPLAPLTEVACDWQGVTKQSDRPHQFQKGGDCGPSSSTLSVD